MDSVCQSKSETDLASTSQKPACRSFKGEFLITEFSPVWHHYKYKEKPDFIYRDNYNINIPLEVSLDLERIIVESMFDDVTN